MAQNTVEATLRSRYDDGIARGIQHTENVLRQGLGSMGNAFGSFSSGVSGVFDSAVGQMGVFRAQLTRAANESDSHFKKISLGATVLAVAIIEAFLRAGAAVASFFFNLVKEASELTELKLSFEGLTSAMDVNADVLLNKLKRGTEGIVSTTALLRNANRVLQSEVPITTAQYAKLVENVFRLAKAAGADTTQAVNTLTDALIRGNTRGLQAVGVHVAVKDAVSEMAQAMGLSAGRMADDSRLRAFYNELLEKTGAAAAKLPPHFISVEDAIQRVNNTWRGYLLQIGEAIGRSGVLQEGLRRLNERLFDLKNSKEDLEQLTLGVNQFFIAALRGFATGAEAVGLFATAWNFAWGIVGAVVNSAAALVSLGLAVITTQMGWVLSVLAKLPGAAGKAFKAMADEMAFYSTYFSTAAQEFGKGLANSFAGTDDTRQKLNGLADSSRSLAAEMQKFADEVIRGSGGLRQHGNEAGDAAEKQKKLNEQLKTFNDLRREIFLRTATPEQAALTQLLKDFEEIGKLNLIGEEKRRQLQIQALLAYDAKLRELESKRNAEERQAVQELNESVAKALGSKESVEAMTSFIKTVTGQATAELEDWWQRFLAEAAKKREEERRKQVSEVLSSASAIARAIDLSRQGKLGPEIGLEAMRNLPRLIADVQRQIEQLQRTPMLSEQQLQDLTNLQVKLEELKRINWTPWQKAMQGMKEEARQFAQKTADAFSAFFADLASGQENAGKKLLAGFVGMIGQMLVHAGTYLMTMGMIEVALAMTKIGRMNGHSVAAGLAAIAQGAVIAALGGTLVGAASAMAQTNNAGTGASFQNDVPRPTSGSQVPVYMVGAPRGAQTPGQAAPASPPMKLTLELRTPPGWVAKEVVREVKGNNVELRTVLQNA